MTENHSPKPGLTTDQKLAILAARAKAIADEADSIEADYAALMAAGAGANNPAGFQVVGCRATPAAHKALSNKNGVQLPFYYNDDNELSMMFNEIVISRADTGFHIAFLHDHVEYSYIDVNGEIPDVLRIDGFNGAQRIHVKAA